jgi:hypothetical protein
MPWTGEFDVQAIVAAGYPYELLGLCYYVLFLFMGRKRVAADYTNRSRGLALLAAMSMVGSVPFHYANTVAGVVAMLALAIIALASTLADAVSKRNKNRSS